MIVGNIVLYSWPLVVAILFRTTSKPTALLAAILAGYLLLPEQIVLDLQGLPPLNKNTIPALAAFFVVLMMNTGPDTPFQKGWLPQGILPKILIFGLAISTFPTVITNSDPLSYGLKFLPALRFWDAFSMIMTILTILLPLFLGRKFLARPDQQRLLLVALAIAGAFYSLLALFEIRMSPQLNNMVYGFFPSSWLQHIRGNGFRPLVFLNHGLWLAIFFSAAILAAFGLIRLSENPRKLIFLFAGLWLLMTLILSRSLGALAITLILLPAVILLGKRQILMVAATLSTIVLIYPMLRGAGLVPVDQIMEWAQGISSERAASLSFRFGNEDVLLEKARQRPLFGWGGWGRNFVFDDLGTRTSLTDGYWILIIGKGGWIRYLMEFGLLCFPPILAVLYPRRYQLGFETSLLMLILVGNLIDLLPNATITPVTWMIAGAVWGRLELGRIPETGEAPAPLSQTSRRLVYSRNSNKPTDAAADQPSLPADSTPNQQRYTRQKTRINQREADVANEPEKQ